jgi:16S rRNA (guanine1207-N2)-methyltransferase
MNFSLQTLFLPLETGDVKPNGPALFIGAAPCPGIALFEKETLDCRQVFCPAAHALQKAGYKTSPDMETIPLQAFQTVLVALPKQAEEARYWLALGLRAAKPSGKLLVAAANDAGGGRIAGWLKEKGLLFHSYSKHKARCALVEIPPDLPDVSGWLQGGQQRQKDFGNGLNLYTQPGLFSWNRPDIGSRLLADFLEELEGEGADFGCGLGYLSARLLQKNGKIRTLHLLDADYRAVTLAAGNVQKEGVTVKTHWDDLSRPLKGLPKLDFIVMNPPFHTGKQTESGLGQAFIRTAADFLKPGGVLLKVANAHLPYESLLDTLFSHTEKLYEKNGYKIYRAVK